MPDKSSRNTYQERVQESALVNNLHNAWKRYFELFCWIRDKADNDKLPNITDLVNCNKEDLEELENYDQPVLRDFLRPPHTIEIPTCLTGKVWFNKAIGNIPDRKCLLSEDERVELSRLRWIQWTESMDKKYAEVLGGLERSLEGYERILNVKLRGKYDYRFWYEPRMPGIESLGTRIKLKGIESIKPYGKVENYKSCKLLLGSYTYGNRETDNFRETQYDPEGYYNKILHSIENNIFQATEKPVLKEVKGEDRQQEEKVILSDEQLQTNIDKNIFRYKGGRWEITFAGKTIFPKDKKGFRYISYVLFNPKEELHNFRLYQLVNNPVTGSVTKEQSFDAKINPERSTKVRATKGDRGDDYLSYKKMLDNIDEEDKELKIERSELEIDGIDMSRLNEINEKLGQNNETRKLISKDFKSDGNDKSAKEKIIYNVYINIYRSLRTIKQEHPDLHTHLKAFLANSKEYTSYSPDRDILWQTNRS